MIQSYNLKVRVFFDGEEVQNRTQGFLLADEANITTKTWIFNNLKEAINSIPDCASIFKWTWKPLFGKEFYGLEVESQPFMWSSLDKKSHTLMIEYSYIPCEVSINKILQYSDSSLAIQYLKERGLAVCPIGK